MTFFWWNYSVYQTIQFFMTFDDFFQQTIELLFCTNIFDILWHDFSSWTFSTCYTMTIFAWNYYKSYCALFRDFWWLFSTLPFSWKFSTCYTMTIFAWNDSVSHIMPFIMNFVDMTFFMKNFDILYYDFFFHEITLYIIPSHFSWLLMIFFRHTIVFTKLFFCNKTETINQVFLRGYTTVRFIWNRP